jgi:hypothetical protein
MRLNGMQDNQITLIEKLNKVKSQLDSIDADILKAQLDIAIWEANNALRVSEIHSEISRKITMAGTVKW